MIPCSSPHIGFFFHLVNNKLHCGFHHCRACFSFSGGFHVSGQIWPLWKSPNVLIIIYVSGTYDYLHIHESYVNLILYLYLFLLNKTCLSLSLSLSLSLNGNHAPFITIYFAKIWIIFGVFGICFSWHQHTKEWIKARVSFDWEICLFLPCRHGKIYFCLTFWKYEFDFKKVEKIALFEKIGTHYSYTQLINIIPPHFSWTVVYSKSVDAKRLFLSEVSWCQNCFVCAFLCVFLQFFIGVRS